MNVTIPIWVLVIGGLLIIDPPTAVSLGNIVKVAAFVIGGYSLYYLARSLWWLVGMVDEVDWRAVLKSVSRVGIVVAWTFILFVAPAIALLSVSVLLPNTLTGALMPLGWFVYMGCFAWWIKRKKAQQATIAQTG